MQKRSRSDFNDEKPDSKRAKIQVINLKFQSIIFFNIEKLINTNIQESSECEAEYQVPTSSQKDQEDDSVIVVDSDDEENDYEVNKRNNSFVI